MQPSPVEIQREVEALRDIRRRSTAQGGPGSLVLDPDLPNESSPSSPTAGYWTSGSTPGLTNGESSSSSHEDGSSSERSAADDPFHLFWVPARLHPEIAPTEFRAFLKEHARGPSADGSGPLSRSPSNVSVSSRLGRRTSMLSNQFDPNASDVTETEHILPLRRNRSSIYNSGPQLTINDLQKLDELAEEASRSDDPTRLRSILRRSLSLNVAPSAMDMMDNMSDPGEDADSPIIIPRPGQILRRAARTKIRKPGLPGDGGGHRFGSSTRRSTTGARAPPALVQRSSSDLSSSDHSEPLSPPGRPRVFSGEGFTEEPGSIRPESYSEEAALIFDSYADIRDELDDDESMTALPSPTLDSRGPPSVVTSPPSPVSIELPISPPIPTIHPPSEPISNELPPTTPIPIIHQPQPQRVATLRPPASDPASARGNSPDSLRSADGTNSRSHSPASETSSVLSTSPTPRREKDKKGLFGFGRDKSGKKVGKEKDREGEQREKAEREREEEIKKVKEKESGFFGSLFGGGKKKQEDGGAQSGPGSGRESPASMLGTTKTAKGYVPPTSPQFTGVGGSYARYPIHVERAIYRLSHIKLANPRRPLYEQVLISNLMFWYLGVINKTQAPASQAPPVQGQQQQSGGQPAPGEREQKEAEERQRAEKERMEKEKEREREQKKEAHRRGPLTKASSSGAPAGRRAAEMPVRGPQYEMQHRVMEQEYGGFGSGSSQPSRSSAMPTGGAQPRPGPSQTAEYYNASGSPQSQPRQQKSHLPPGAMPPAGPDQPSWLANPPATSPPKSQRPTSPPSPPPGAPASRRSRSPPPHNHNRFAPSPIHKPDLYTSQSQGAGNTIIPPSRSRSATGATTPTAPTQINGKLKKNSSAQAIMAPATVNGRKPRKSDIAPPTSSTGEEEDVPLALWQQQQQRRR